MPSHLSNAYAPSLVIAGEKESKAMRESVNDIAKALPNAKAILFRKCKHDIPWKSSDDFNCTLREWFNDKELTSQSVQPYK